MIREGLPAVRGRHNRYNRARGLACGRRAGYDGAMAWNWQASFREHPAFGPWYQRTASRPSWVTRSALGAAVLVVVIPLVLLTLAAVVVGLGVFFVLSAAASVANLLGGGFARRGGDGRRNVRVIER